MAQESALVINIDTRRSQKDTSDLDKKLKGLEKTGEKTEKQFKDTGKAAKRMGRDAKAAASSFKTLVAMATAFVTVGLGASIFNTVRSFQSMKAQLKTLTGDMESANGAFAALTDFAANTPYALEQSVMAFQKLTALGLTPSEQALYSYGNTASAMGKDLNQMIEAVADAATGEFERLKEFGIKARKQGDEVSFVFQGVTTTVKNNAEDIQKYLISIGETKFATAMADQMDTLNGQMSNLGDQWEQLKYALGQELENSTFIADLADQLKRFREALPGLVARFKSFRQFLFLMFDELVAGFKIMMNNFHSLTVSGVAGFKVLWAKAVDFVLKAFGKVAGGLAYVAEFFDDSKEFAKTLRQIESNANNAAKSEARINAEVKATVGEINQKNRAIREELEYRRQVAFANENEYRQIIENGVQIDNNNKKLEDFIKKNDAAGQQAPEKTKEQKEREKKFDSSVDGLKDYIKDQEFLNTTIGKTSDEVEVLNLRREVQKSLLLATTEAQRALVEQLGLEAEIALRNNQAAQKDVELKERAKELISEIDGGLSKYNDTVAEYNNLRKNGLLTDEQYNKLLVDLKRNNASLLSSQEQAQLGLQAGLESYSQSIGSTYDNIKRQTESVARSLEDAFVEFAMTGKLSVKDMANSIIADILRIQARTVISNVLGGALGGESGGGIAEAISSVVGGNAPNRGSGENESALASALSSGLVPNDCACADPFMMASDSLKQIGVGLPPKITDSITKGSNSFSSIFDNFGNNFSSILDGFGSSFSSILSSIGSSFGGGGGGGFLGSIFGGLFGAKNGAAFAHGNVVPFAKGSAFTNQIVKDPTVFKFAKGGVGVMGEAGEEAIMPLSRTSSGELGVKMANAKKESKVEKTSEKVAHINMGGIHISTPDVSGFNSSIGQIEVNIRDMVQRAGRNM